MADPRKRRMTYDMTLHFLVPGLVSQLAILGLVCPIIWRSWRSWRSLSVEAGASDAGLRDDLGDGVAGVA